MSLSSKQGGSSRASDDDNKTLVKVGMYIDYLYVSAKGPELRTGIFISGASASSSKAD